MPQSGDQFPHRQPGGLQECGAHRRAPSGGGDRRHGTRVGQPGVHGPDCVSEQLPSLGRPHLRQGVHCHRGSVGRQMKRQHTHPNTPIYRHTPHTFGIFSVSYPPLVSAEILIPPPPVSVMSFICSYSCKMGGGVTEKMPHLFFFFSFFIGGFPSQVT